MRFELFFVSSLLFFVVAQGKNWMQLIYGKL